MILAIPALIYVIYQFFFWGYYYACCMLMLIFYISCSLKKKIYQCPLQDSAPWAMHSGYQKVGRLTSSHMTDHGSAKYCSSQNAVMASVCWVTRRISGTAHQSCPVQHNQHKLSQWPNSTLGGAFCSGCHEGCETQTWHAPLAKQGSHCSQR